MAQDVKLWVDDFTYLRTTVLWLQTCLCTEPESWTTYSRQKHRLNGFHLRRLRRILGIAWRDHITNIDVLQQAGVPSMYVLLTQRRFPPLAGPHEWRPPPQGYYICTESSQLAPGQLDVQCFAARMHATMTWSRPTLMHLDFYVVFLRHFLSILIFAGLVRFPKFHFDFIIHAT